MKIVTDDEGLTTYRAPLRCAAIVRTHGGGRLDGARQSDLKRCVHIQKVALERGDAAQQRKQV